MDLHVVGPLASPAERAAVDAVLDPEIGPPTSGWVGARRDVATDGRAAHGGRAARARRDLLLPALHAVQNRFGWISRPALQYICRRLTVPPAEAYGVATFYTLFTVTERPPAVAHVCDDVACRLSGAEELCSDLERTLGPAGAPARDGRMTWLRSPCLGLCERAPAALFTIAGETPLAVGVAPVDAVGVVSRLEDPALVARDVGRDVIGGGSTAATADAITPATAPTAEDRLAAVRRSAPQAGDDGLVLLGRVGRVDPTSLAEYHQAGGYRALEQALATGAEAVIAEVVSSGLVGRGGAAFPTGRKWEAVRSAAVRPHYLVCNADESEPGTFKDRLLLEEDPFAILEGMTIAAFAAGCERGYVYLRGEYPLAAARLAFAIAQARTAGLLGAGIGGSRFSFDVELRRGAGAYICGEETALFESIEGKRGEPRNKPPFPVTHGLFGKPTVINNVETLANVPWIVLNGGAAYAAIGTGGSKGRKLFCVSGHVRWPGVYELPFGSTLRELIELAGGIPRARATGRSTDDVLRAILLGGAAGAFVGPDALDTPLSQEGARAAGAPLGSGVVMVFDETADLAGTLLRIAAFFRDESCGQCVPCRVGTVRQEEALQRIAAGRPNGSRADDLALLRDVARAMRDASICGLGQTAANAVESALDRLDPFPTRARS